MKTLQQSQGSSQLIPIIPFKSKKRYSSIVLTTISCRTTHQNNKPYKTTHQKQAIGEANLSNEGYHIKIDSQQGAIYATALAIRLLNVQSKNKKKKDNMHGPGSCCPNQQ